MKRLKIWLPKFGFWLGLMLLVFACKKKDETPPMLSVLTPAKASSFSYTPTFTVSGSVSDNVGLSKIEVSLMNTQYQLVVSPSRYPIDSKSTNYRVEYEITDVYLPKGNYFLKVEAFDLANNKNSVFVPIYLDELPLTLQKVYYIGLDALNNAKLYDLITQKPILNLDKDASDFVFDKKNRTFYVSSTQGNSFNGYNIVNDSIFSPKFSHYQAGNNFISILPSVTKNYVVLAETPPYLKVFTPSGVVLGAHSNLVDVPQEIHEFGQRTYIVVPGIGVQRNEIDVLNPNANYGITHQINLTEKIMGITDNGSEICVLTQAGGDAYTRYYRATDLVQIGNSKYFGTTVLGWKKLGDEVYIQTPTQLIKENIGLRTTPSINWKSGGYTKLFTESLQNVVYGVTPTSLEKIDANSGNTLATYPIPTGLTVQKIGFLYNK